MGWLDRAIKSGVEQGVREAIAEFSKPGGGLDRLVEQVVWKQMAEKLSRTKGRLTRLGFLWALRVCFHKHGCDYAEAARLADNTLAQYLADEKIQYGDPDYTWTRACADEIADEYEFRHWERAA